VNVTLDEVVQAAFEDELEQIALSKDAAAPGELRPNTALRTGAPRMPTIKLAPGSKIAATRAVKEWQKAQAGGDQGSADAIAKGYGDLNLKPRQLKDVSMGGEEAGVDLMMGKKFNPTTGEGNEGGYLARKLYKPDSSITRGEFTPQLLAEKQKLTDTARSLSPEAKQMVPGMYGHKSYGQGGLQRSVSYHEYVPGVSDLRGQKAEVNGRSVYSNPRDQYMGQVEKVKQTVLDPMAAKGMAMGDVSRPPSAGGTNFGNVVGTKQGPKILDFLPENEKGTSIQTDNLMKHQPAAVSDIYNRARSGEANPQLNSSLVGGSKFSGKDTPYQVKDIRKEVFKPTMHIEPPTAQVGGASSAAAKPAAPGASMPTAPQGLRPAAPVPGRTMPTAPQGIGGALAKTAPTAPIPLVRPHVPSAPMAAAGGMLQRAEHSVAAKAPGMLTRVGKFFK
jgi:hypothetical protein